MPEACPLCGKKSLRYRKRTRDFSCQKCPFEGNEERIAALGTVEERDWEYDRILNSIPAAEQDAKALEFLGHVSELPLKEMGPAFDAFMAGRATRTRGSTASVDGPEMGQRRGWGLHLAIGAALLVLIGAVLLALTRR